MDRNIQAVQDHVFKLVKIMINLGAMKLKREQRIKGEKILNYFHNEYPKAIRNPIKCNLSPNIWVHSINSNGPMRRPMTHGNSNASTEFQFPLSLNL